MTTNALRYAHEQRPRHLDDLLRLLRQPSVAAQGLGMGECAELVRAMMEETGFTTEIVPLDGGFPVVYGEIDVGAPRTLVLYNHYDVQPAEPLEEWESDPFAPEIRDGRIYARGVADNKGNLATRLKAIESYLKSGTPLPVNIKMVVEGEEEIGSPRFHQFFERFAERLRGDGVLWESGGLDSRGRPLIQFGCKGILYVELRAYGARHDLHSSLAPIVPNPAWRLVEALHTLRDPKTGRCRIAGFYDDVRPPSAAERELLERAPLDEAEMLERLGLDAFLGGSSGRPLQEELLYAPTCTICGLAAGYTGPGSKTVLPHRAVAKIDFRLVPDQRAADIEAKLRRHLREHGFGDIEVVVLGPEDPAQTDPDHPLVAAVAEAARAAYGREPVLRPRMAGTGPMFLFHRAGLTGTVNGCGISHPGSLVHAPNENAFVDDYYRCIEHVIHIIDRFGR